MSDSDDDDFFSDDEPQTEIYGSESYLHNKKVIEEINNNKTTTVASASFTGQFSDVIVFNRILTRDERNTVISYTWTRYWEWFQNQSLSFEWFAAIILGSFIVAIAAIIFAQ